MPLVLLGAILGLPALLILVYDPQGHVYHLVDVGIYHVWPCPCGTWCCHVYAYWHFDDFSWGQTQQD
jgi:chitin synthase